MADVLKVKVEGLAELDRKLRTFAPKLARKALRSAVAAGASVIKKEAKSRAPVDTGRLAKKAIYTKRAREKGNRLKEVYVIGVRSGRRESHRDRDAFYWRFIEFGTKKFNPMPFLAPAFQAKKNEALQKIIQKLRINIEKLSTQR